LGRSKLSKEETLEEQYVYKTPRPSGVAMGMSKEIVQQLHDMDKGASELHCKEPYCILEKHSKLVAHYDNLHDMVWSTWKKPKKRKPKN